ncbi:MAG: hypothetical protein JWQ07_3517 [Ramlibacter sp.]|nr:hypothetical protein [Ramlibacter sp.]
MWSRLRQDESLRCYFEPLHERIAKLNPAAVTLPPEAGVSVALRHPAQERNYFAEYLDFVKSSPTLFSRSLSYDRYLLRPEQSDDHLRAYLGELISAAGGAGRTAVLCFCRSQMRSAWMKRAFGGRHVAQVRNPFDQWASFQVRPYFVQKLVLTALKLRTAHPGAFVHIEQFERKAQARSSPQSRGGSLVVPVDAQDALRLFLLVWIASTLQAVACCDHVLDVDRLSVDAGYQQESAAWFKSAGCLVDFADCATPVTGGSQESRLLFRTVLDEAVNAIGSHARCLVVADEDAVRKRLPSLSGASSAILAKVL